MKNSLIRNTTSFSTIKQLSNVFMFSLAGQYLYYSAAVKL